MSVRQVGVTTGIRSQDGLPTRLWYTDLVHRFPGVVISALVYLIDDTGFQGSICFCESIRSCKVPKSPMKGRSPVLGLKIARPVPGEGGGGGWVYTTQSGNKVTVIRVYFVNVCKIYSQYV